MISDDSVEAFGEGNNEIEASIDFCNFVMTDFFTLNNEKKLSPHLIIIRDILNRRLTLLCN